MSNYSLSIGTFAQRSGVSQQTLRSWERRHGFPTPRRIASGHRRYSEQQVTQVQAVLDARASGLSLPTAIATALRVHAPAGGTAEAGSSLHAHLLQAHPGLRLTTVNKPALIAFSHALEDEIAARAERKLLFGSFQRARFYDQARRRWRELSIDAALAVVFADFAAPDQPPRGPIELPVPSARPLAREWSLVYRGTQTGVCLSALEAPASDVRRDSACRRFELAWSSDPTVVLDATEFCLQTAVVALPELAKLESQLLSWPPLAGPEVQLAFAAATIDRTLPRLSAWPFAPAADGANRDVHDGVDRR